MLPLLTLALASSLAVTAPSPPPECTPSPLAAAPGATYRGCLIVKPRLGPERVIAVTGGHDRLGQHRTFHLQDAAGHAMHFYVVAGFGQAVFWMEPGLLGLSPDPRRPQLSYGGYPKAPQELVDTLAPAGGLEGGPAPRFRSRPLAYSALAHIGGRAPVEGEVTIVIWPTTETAR